MIFGIDISENNGRINWDAVKTNNPLIDFVYIKSCEGIGYNDKSRTVNSQGAERVGIKVGYYHFASLNSLDVVNDATAEANYFMGSMAGLPPAQLPPILDIEKNTANLNPSQCLTWINTFFTVLKKSYPKYGIYSYTPFLNENLPSNHGLGNIPLWIAQYNGGMEPKLPTGWATCWLHQYDNKGKINGINGNCDLNKVKTNII